MNRMNLHSLLKRSNEKSTLSKTMDNSLSSSYGLRVALLFALIASLITLAVRKWRRRRAHPSPIRLLLGFWRYSLLVSRFLVSSWW